MPTTDDHVFLLGRPPISELFGYIKTMALDGHNMDLGALAQEWRTANGHVQTLEVAEGGVADNVPVLPLPLSISELATRVQTESAFQQGFRMVPCDFGLVELDRLVVFQKFINLGFISVIHASLPQPHTEENLAQLAFGLDRPAPPHSVQQTGQHAFSFVSDSTDIRPLESALLGATQVNGFSTTGRPMGYVAIGVGLGSNYLNVISFNGRLVLNNGSHRAYAMRALGVTHAPCIVQRVTLRDELEVVASQDLLQNPDRYLTAPRPPLLKDYFDPQLRKIIAVPRKKRLVQVQIQVGVTDVPA